MKILKITIFLIVGNAILLPFYGLTTIDSLADMLQIATHGLKEMFIPTCYMVGVYYLFQSISDNWFQKNGWRIALGTLLLIFVVIVSQYLWSVMRAKDTLTHFVGFWGFYFLWTLLSCILIPQLDRYLSKK